MQQYTYLLHFNELSQAEAHRYAEELRNVLLNASPEIAVQRKHDDPGTQDFGATLVLVLGTPAVVAAATAIGNWLQLRTKASLTIETPDKKIVAQNVTRKDASRLAELFLTQR